MAKYRINYKTSPHGTISWSHGGNDSQYCEAGEPVTIDWQPSAGWGLQEAHYRDGANNKTAINLTTRTFTMPAKNITIEGTFKRFKLGDWTGDGEKDNIIVVGSNGEAKASTTKISDLLPIDNAKSVTYSQLVTLRDGGNLVPGTWYRITDYTCTTAQENTQSAGHLFDIVVLALDESHLAEEAFAAHHAGDTYFANSDLDAWKLWYCIDNDTDRFAWADSTNGKGVVYRMIDEFNNDMPYDFKNIQFIRHKKDLDHIVNAASYIADDGGSAAEIQIANNITASATANKAVRSFLYGFEDIREASEFSDLLDFNSVTYEDDDLYCVLQETDNYVSAVAKVLDDTLDCYTFMADDGTDASLSASNNIHDTEMLPWIEDNAAKLNNGVCFGSNCYGWSCGNYCNGWSCGNYCNGWSCGSNCNGWSCGNDCYGWSCGSNCNGWSCGNDCYGWSCGNYCNGWSCGNYCNGWSCGNYCNGWSFGNDCYGWSCGNYCYGWSCGNSCKKFKILDGFDGSNFDSLDDEGLVANTVYCQFVGIDSNGDIKIWNPAD